MGRRDDAVDEAAWARLRAVSTVRPWVPVPPRAAEGVPQGASGRTWSDALEAGEPLSGRRSGWRDAVEDRMPVPLRAGAVRIGLRGGHAVVLALLAAVAVVAGLLLVRAAAPAEQEVPPRVELAAVGTPVPDGPASVPSSPAPSLPGPRATATAVVVDVAGRVRRPGVQQLPAGSRVVDALRAAGGPVPGTDLVGLNLARLLVDGEQVAVGVPAAAAAPPSAPPPSTGDGLPTESGSGAGPIDLNSATMEQLDTLPGVGPVLAQRILDWRAEHGRFSSVDELGEVSGIGDARLQDLRSRVRV